MAAPLDVATLFFASFLSRFAYLVVFFVIALRRPQERCLWHWIGALVTSTIGTFVVAQIPPTDDLGAVSGFIVYVCFSASLTLSWSGLRLFYGRTIVWPAVVALTILPSLVSTASMAAGFSLNTALLPIFAICMVSAGLPVAEILRPSAEQRLWSQYVVALAFFGYCLIFLISIVMILLGEMNSRTVDSGRMSIVVDQVTGVLVYFGYLAMAGERASLELQGLAEVDPLTGLANRRGLDRLVKSRDVVSPNRPSTGLLVADIDHFKSINDTFGHDAGDTVLKQFSERIRSSLRTGDIAARWGGEEFLVILPNSTVDQNLKIAERLRAAIQAEPFDLPAGPVHVTVSIGLTELQTGEGDLVPAMRRADNALYAAKGAGRNRVGRFDGLAAPAALAVA
ncbi:MULTISPECIES: GGDEF domain-containing protein [unclassified Aureimonas]|uniref:GGDEF domain-containing protein n=1 Tax=unclassified Aureimonas TaxID=2615206 RepID=UPI0006FD3904|nr:MULTISPECIES: GGDEF domain-containing protein [unclassified Aureimonas]KQT53808.1 hypothetical protein ASG62_11200 [Aureimonas sp. Leaf427]KQT71751.1 hypothetical protein ASG54_19960 [Aureimonas sp. Leaf460]